MYVCLCKAVTEREVRRAIDEGLASMRELRRELGVCSCCGKCGPVARAMLAEAVPSDRPGAVGRAVPGEPAAAV
ncbi:MAG: (2Fe-2S)-binding protein [Arhodomonas sp.]|nr:(2Fe-2S)-binding protein [Arhodomonas sp.]